MTIYAVGDLQGCLSPLLRLLEQVNFNPTVDQLWAAGDIVNRGPESLQTLRFVKNLGEAFRMVLGNHDLHLLATAAGFRAPNPKDTLDDILKAPDRDELLNWLRQQPLLISAHGYAMVHAGIPPHWSLSTAQSKARQVEQVLQGDDAHLLFANMYGNEPPYWHQDQEPVVQLRTITNYFTRMRFCSANGHLELMTKQAPSEAPTGYAPWYAHPERQTVEENIIFGHWAALNGAPCGKNLHPLDTGCVWGGRLRLMNLDNQKYIHCSCGLTD